jgi:hypothetical protein
MTLKFANQRYVIWEIVNDTVTSYSTVTYDFEKEKYHWWEFGENSGETFVAEYSGQLLDDKLFEWESVVFPLENGKVKFRELIKTDNKIEVMVEVSKGGEIIGASKDTLTWSEELPTQKK